MLNTNSHRIAFVASSLSDQDPEEAFAPTSFSSEIWNSKPSTFPSTFGKTTYLDANPLNLPTTHEKKDYIGASKPLSSLCN